MSRLDAARRLDESPRSRILSARILASACSCAQRLQASLEGLGGASTLLLLSGVGVNFVVSYLSGLITSDEMSRQIAPGLAGGNAIGADLL